MSRNQLRQTASVTFSPRNDLALAVTLGAVDGDLELGGLRLTDLQARGGREPRHRPVLAAERGPLPRGHAHLPARRSCRCSAWATAAATASRSRAAWAGCTLDFGGAWTSSSHVAVKMALGEVALRLPRTVGVRITLDKFLASFEPQGMVRRGTSYLSPGYDQATRHLDIDVTTAIGGVTVDWLE